MNKAAKQSIFSVTFFSSNTNSVPFPTRQGQQTQSDENCLDQGIVALIKTQLLFIHTIKLV